MFFLTEKELIEELTKNKTMATAFIRDVLHWTILLERDPTPPFVAMIDIEYENVVETAKVEIQVGDWARLAEFRNTFGYRIFHDAFGKIPFDAPIFIEGDRYWVAWGKEVDVELDPFYWEIDGYNSSVRIRTDHDRVIVRLF